MVHEIDHMSDLHVDSSFHKQSMKIDNYFKINEWIDHSIGKLMVIQQLNKKDLHYPHSPPQRLFFLQTTVTLQWKHRVCREATGEPEPRRGEKRKNNLCQIMSLRCCCCAFHHQQNGGRRS